jgi:hypothetical protein
MHTFKITVPESRRPSASTIEIDGRPLIGATKVTLTLEGGKIGELNLTVRGKIEVADAFEDSEILRVRRPNYKETERL